MAEYMLQDYESLVHRTHRVLDAGWLPGVNHELFLTTRNLAFTSQGFFGGRKDDTIIPLHDIRIFKGRAQVTTERREQYSFLTIYLREGTRKIGFGDRREADFVAEKINELLTGTPASREIFDTSATAKVADAMKEGVSTFKKAFGISAPAAAAPRPRVVAGDCVSCGAPISGQKDSAATCSYCDTPTQL